ncbi:Hypothetical predicted protein, partial [Pelobates cultripes]
MDPSQTYKSVGGRTTYASNQRQEGIIRGYSEVVTNSTRDHRKKDPIHIPHRSPTNGQRSPEKKDYNVPIRNRYQILESGKTSPKFFLVFFSQKPGPDQIQTTSANTRMGLTRQTSEILERRKNRRRKRPQQGETRTEIDHKAIFNLSEQTLQKELRFAPTSD